MDAWGLDVVLSASQKGLGAPPGLSVLVANPRALSVWEERKTRGVKSGSFYSSWEKCVARPFLPPQHASMACL